MDRRAFVRALGMCGGALGSGLLISACDRAPTAPDPTVKPRLDLQSQEGSSGSCRLCRREGMKLFLKGDKCFTAKCPLERR